MKNRLNLALLFVLLFSSAAFAEHVSLDRAQAIANNFYKELDQTTLRSQSTLTLHHVEQNQLRSTDLETYYYIFTGGDDGGFVIVAGDDRAKPILGYSADGKFDVSDLPPALKWWLEKYCSQISYATTKATTADSEWAQLEEGNSLKAGSSKLLQTANWNQYSPFNDYCPTIGENRTLTGCLPTAMAIIMKYHQWPAKGSGSNSYTTTTAKIPLSVNFEEATYNWSIMKDNYNYDDQSESAREVAKLIYHSGVSMEVDYGVSTTNGYNALMYAGLVENFGYDRDMKIKSREGGRYSYTAWYDMIKKEIDNSRIVYYNGQNANNTAGHGFICDGYNDGDIHINWGWGGYCNGYYPLDALAATSGDYTDENNYSHQEYIMIDIKKAGEDYVAAESDLVISGVNGGIGMFIDTQNVTANQYFYVYTASIYNPGFNDFTGKVAIGLYRSNGELREVISDKLDAELLRGWYYYLFTFSCRVTSSFQSTDKIHLITSTDNGSSWQIVGGDSDIATSLPVVNNSISRVNITWSVGSGITVSDNKHQTVKSVIKGDYVDFSLTSNHSNLVVKANSEIIQPQNDGTYYIYHIKENTHIEISATVAVTSVGLDQTEASLEIDETLQLNATIKPNGASNKKVTWKSDDPTIATVSSTGLVTAVAIGETTITVTTEDGKKTASCTITVTDVPNSIEQIPGFSVTITGRTLMVNTPSAEKLTVYSFSGIPLFMVDKPAGETSFQLSQLPQGNYILTGSSGWSEKFMLARE